MRASFYPIQKLLFSFTLILFSVIGASAVIGQSASSFYEFSKSLYQEGNYEDALININRAIDADSSIADYYLLRAHINCELQLYDKSIRDCYRIFDLVPDYAEAYFLRGDICMLTESYGGAVMFYGKVINQSKDSVLLQQTYRNRGMAFMNLNKLNEAHADLMKSYEYDQEDIQLLLSLAELFHKLNRNDEAIYTANKISNKQSDNSEAYNLLGVIYTEEKQYEKALKAFSKFTDLHPDIPDGYNNIAKVYLEKGDYDIAMQHANKAISLAPDEPVGYKMKGIICLAKGLNEQGCDYLFKAMQLKYLEKYDYDLLDLYIEKCE